MIESNYELGRLEGREEVKIEVGRRLIDKGMSAEEAAEIAGVDVDREKGLLLGKQEGRHEGRQEEASLFLRRQLIRRFGPLPNWTENRLAEATLTQMEPWGEAVIDAKTLEEVFAPPPSKQ